MGSKLTENMWLSNLSLQPKYARSTFSSLPFATSTSYGFSSLEQVVLSKEAK